MKNTLALSAAAVALLITSLPVQAAYVVALTQEVIGGINDVVATGSGAIDLTDLTVNGSIPSPLIELIPTGAYIGTGPTTSAASTLLGGITGGPTSFGSGSTISANSGSGDTVTLDGPSGELTVPTGYISGHPLSDTSTYNNATFATLGVTPGTYKWTWGTGADADSFTLVIAAAAAAVPEPSIWAMMLLGFTGLAFAGWRAGGRVRLAA